MFLSESIVRAIQADREREIERTTRERRLIEAATENWTNAPVVTTRATAASTAPRSGRPRRDRSGLPA